MKRLEFFNEIKNLPKDELKDKARASLEELMKLRFRGSAGDLPQSHRLREIRRNFARLKTLMEKAT